MKFWHFFSKKDKKQPPSSIVPSSIVPGQRIEPAQKIDPIQSPKPIQVPKPVIAENIAPLIKTPSLPTTQVNNLATAQQPTQTFSSSIVPGQRIESDPVQRIESAKPPKPVQTPESVQASEPVIAENIAPLAETEANLEADCQQAKAENIESKEELEVIDPVPSQIAPYMVEMIKGRSYKLCRCGKSKKQPFCDESHICKQQRKNSEDCKHKPYIFKAKRSGYHSICGCMESYSYPICDGTHDLLL